MYTTFSNTFNSATKGDRKFFFTVNNQTGGAEPVYEGKINDDKSVKKFRMKKESDGSWKIQSQELPEWVLGLEKDFSDRIEASIGKN